MLHWIHHAFFGLTLLAVCWLAMQAVHEMGHVAAAWATGGVIQQVVLNPLTISSTAVSPNPNPGIVVWAGPIGGALMPLLLVPLWPAKSLIRKLAVFFAGLCMIGNGAYLGLRWIDNVGDCAVISQTGFANWTMILFGSIATISGFWLWHGLGSVQNFLDAESSVSPIATTGLVALLILMLSCEFVFSPR